MAVTENTYTGNGSTVLYSFTFPYLAATDIKVSINGTLTTAYTLANATTVQFNVAPANGAAIRIYRATNDASVKAAFFSGSSIRAQDLNDNFTQGIYIAQETANFAAATDASAIQATANTALANSNTAITTANAASATANGIAGTANTALSNANAAVSTANTANSTANTANNNATSALAVANAALPKAGGTMTGNITFNTGQTFPDVLPLTGGTLTGNLTIPSLNGGPLAGARNRIINGNFDIWQRGTSTPSWIAPITNYYWPDRWVFNSTGTGGNGSVSQQAFTPGQTDVPGEPTFFMRWQITSAASGQTAGSCYVEQRIEDVRTLAGQTATISFYAKGTGTLPNIYLTQTFGSGGSTQVLYTLATNVALSANWTKYTYTVNVGSISGRTIGTNHYVGLTFMVPINTTYTFDLAQVQVEQGTVATPFERRSYGQELALCQRYYEYIYVGSYSPTATGFVSGARVGAAFRWAAEKRAAPSVTTSNFSGTLTNSAAISVTGTYGGLAYADWNGNSGSRIGFECNLTGASEL